jgi:UDP-glucuronate decarboxylase|tara:strand:+ start:6048 stop:7058 length:1011 start_codon:yes stop_codon:yes gene_type:complete
MNDINNINSHLNKSRINFHGKKILITGGAGFLGSWISKVLVEQSAIVTCIDNLASGLASNIELLKKNDNFTFLQHDISTPLNLNKDFDIVMHLASRASPFEFEKYPIQILKANTLGIWIALGIAKKQNARFLYTSTSEVYGDPDPNFIPTLESYFGNVNPIGPRSCYDESKRAGEAYVKAYALQHGIDTRIVRIFNTYGPFMRSDDIYGRVVPRFIEQALTGEPITVFGDGNQTRSFIFVSDQVEGILRLAGMNNLNGEVVNIGNNIETRIIDLARIIKEIIGSDSDIVYSPIPEDDPKRRCPDISKAKKLLNWQPNISLNDGLNKTILWFKSGRF